MEDIENGMINYVERERNIIGECEYCGEYIYDDEYAVKLIDMVFHEDECLSDWVDSNIEKVNI